MLKFLFVVIVIVDFLEGLGIPVAELDNGGYGCKGDEEVDEDHQS